MRLRPHLLLARTALPAVALAALASAPADGAIKPGKANRAAMATGPCVERSLPMLGDLLDVVAASRTSVTDTARAATALRLALDEAGRLAAVLEAGDPASELARLNEEAAEDRFACSADLFAALDSARTLAAVTEGAYDPTAGPLERLWAEQRGRGAPDRLEVSEARERVGWRQLQLEPGRRLARLLRPGMSVALGPAAVGCVLERAAETLHSNGVVRAKLELGGVALAFTPFEPWLTVVDDGDGRPLLSLALSNAACATAGRLAGTAAGDRGDAPLAVDPRTGQPVRTQASVTVIAPGALRAGALAQALLVLGRDGAEAHARSHPGIGVLWIEPAGDFESVRVWAWNLGRIEPAPGVRVEWMTHS